MPLLVAKAARVGIQLLPVIERIGTDPVLDDVIEFAVQEGYELRRQENAPAKKGSRG